MRSRPQIYPHNRFQNPHLFTSEEMRIMIGIFKHEFIDFCTFTQPVSRRIKCFLSHEARIFLFLYRYVHDVSASVLGVLFQISRNTAMNIFNDILYYLLYHDPLIPKVWNDETATDEEIEQFLLEIQEAQSPAIRYTHLYYYKSKYLFTGTPSRCQLTRQLQ